MSQKTAYVCGPLTELSSEDVISAKKFYADIAEVCMEVTGKRAFVPHEHCDPVANAELEPGQVDAIERHQVCELTSVLIVVALAPSWGGGIEVEMANRSDIPVIIFYPAGKRISRLLRGNPAVHEIFSYSSQRAALGLLRIKLEEMRLCHSNFAET